MSINTVPWVEKYRPRVLGDMVLSDATRRFVSAQLHPDNRSHLIMHGRPGIGKTTTARCLATEILGEMARTGYLEINAADERGTKHITTNIEPFCRRKISGLAYKFVVLDEADNLTDKSQIDLVEVVKKYTGKVRFILICNNSQKVTETLQSICHIIQFQPLDLQGSVEYLTGVCQNENLTYSQEGLELICQIGGGDMRKNINNLQKVSYSGDMVTRKNILRVCHYPDPGEIKKIIRLAATGQLQSVLQVFQRIQQEGHYYLDIIASMEHCLIHGNLNHQQQTEMLSELYRLRLNLREPASFNLQFCAMLCKITRD